MLIQDGLRFHQHHPQGSANHWDGSSCQRAPADWPHNPDEDRLSHTVSYGVPATLDADRYHLLVLNVAPTRRSKTWVSPNAVEWKARPPRVQRRQQPLCVRRSAHTDKNAIGPECRGTGP